jgi:hypothetical protein
VDLLDPLDLDLTDGVKGGERLTGVVRFPARYGQGEVDGELLMDGDGEEVTDGMQKRTASSNAWSNSSIASRCEGGRRLVMQALRMITGRLDLLRVESNGGCQTVRRGEGRRLGVKREARLTGWRRN